MAAGTAEVSFEAGLRTVAERLGEEFRKSLAVIVQPELVPYNSAQVDALYDLLRRGVIEVGPGAQL